MRASTLVAVLASLAALAPEVTAGVVGRLPSLATRTSSASSANTTPFVIPSLQEWNGQKGTWSITEKTRIVVDQAVADGIAADAQYTFMANPSTLKDFAASFQEDIEAVTGKRLEVVVGKKASPGDVFLTVSSKLDINNEGYKLDISEKGITIAGATARGAFWGTRTILQMLILGDDGELPQGSARDWPNYNERKLFQDIARKPIPMEDLKEYASLASFFKMNTLHHHYSDNPAVRTKELMPDWRDKYAGFRLRSPEYPWTMYASNDTSYTKEDLRTFQDFIKPRGLDLIPEIDTPAHSLWATKFHPEWSIQNNTVRGDWLDLTNDEVWRFIENVWDEFVPFFDSREISIGADEYNPDKGELVRQYVNHFHDYFATNYNRTIRMWGSDVRLPGTTEINSGIHTDHWDWTYSNPVDLVSRGHKVSNLNAPDVYLVPRTAAYWDYLNNEKIYDLWEPWVFDLFDRGNKSRNLDPTEPLLTGGGFANWNDFMGESVTRVELYDRVSYSMGVFAEKLWTGSKNVAAVEYEDFEAKMKKLLAAIPGITLRRRPASKDQFVLSYDFEDGNAGDASGNGYDGTLHGATVVETTDGHGKVAQLSPDSYISTPLEGIAYPYAVGLWVKPLGNQTTEAVILESGESRILVSNKTNPTVTFEQDGFQYTTNVILPADAWSHLAVVADGQTTYMYYNMKRVASLNWYNSRWDVVRNETMVLTAPLATIGSQNGNSVNALVDGFFALDRTSCAGELSFLAQHYSNALP
jgi:hexosaminidase